MIFDYSSLREAASKIYSSPPQAEAYKASVLEEAQWIKRILSLHASSPSHVSFSESPVERIGGRSPTSSVPCGTTTYPRSALKTSYNPNQEREQARAIERDGWSLENTLDKCLFDAERLIDEDECQRRLRLHKLSVDEYNKRSVAQYMGYGTF